MVQTEARGRIGLANWREHPHSEYAFQRVAEFIPVAEMLRGGDEPHSPGLGALADMRVPGASGETAAVGHFEASHGDHVVVMRGGAVIAEWAAPHLDPARPHIVFSISKSMTGLLAGIAAGDGLLDPDAPVGRVVPAVAQGAYGQATVRDLLDMTVDVDFDEQYADADGDFDRYRRAMLWNPERPDREPETMVRFLASLRAAGSGHGRRFLYASPNIDMLGLAIERAADMRYHRYLAERLLEPMGARGPAYVTVDRAGTARAASGICITTRDLARLGQLVMDGGRGIVPAAWIDDIHRNGNRAAWLAGDAAWAFPQGHYRSCWYQAGDGRGSFAAIGIHGQWLWCDPTADVVIAKTASRPLASDDALKALEIRVLSHIARAFQHG